MNKLVQLKTELKGLAKRIRQNKIVLKNYQREHFGNQGAMGYALRRLQWEYRHKHIAYCLLRGRTIEQIENTHREGNEPNVTLINKYYEEYCEEEAIYIDSSGYAA